MRRIYKIRTVIISGLLLACNLQAAVPVEEIIVEGQGIGSLRLNAGNGAGGRLGLSSFDTPASVDLITSEEIAIKGDYGALAGLLFHPGALMATTPPRTPTMVLACISLLGLYPFLLIHGLWTELKCSEVLVQ